MVKSLPKKITPDPLVNVIAEIRFDSTIAEEELFSSFYSAFKSEYKKFKAKDEIPRSLKDADPTLKFRPDYVMFNDNTSFSFGMNVAFIEFNKEYPGWDVFSSLIKSHFEIVRKANITSSIKRIGLRFINLFEGHAHIEEVINFKESLPINEKLGQQRRFYKTELLNDHLQLLIQIVEESTLQKNGNNLKGIVLDIDSSVASNLPKEINDDVYKHFEDLHQFEKMVFYDLINQDHLKKLKIEY